MTKYRRITYEDRCQIYALSKRGASQESIASVLGVSLSTVSQRCAVITPGTNVVQLTFLNAKLHYKVCKKFL